MTNEKKKTLGYRIDYGVRIALAAGTVAAILAPTVYGMCKFIEWAYLDEYTVSPGYVDPRGTKIEAVDLNKDGKRETVLKVGKKTYLLMCGQDSTPEIRKYSIKPSTTKSGKLEIISDSNQGEAK
jgi:hypothetical protein